MLNINCYEEIEKREEIETIAHNLRAEIGIVSFFPVPVAKIAELKGFECVLFTPPNKRTNNISGLVDHVGKTIHINKLDSNLRQRFTIAHEIGHIQLHGDKEDYVDYRVEEMPDNLDTDKISKEKEADYFAGCLLMPKEVFCEKYKEFKGNLIQVAKFFGVSTQAAWKRSNALEIKHNTEEEKV